MRDRAFFVAIERSELREVQPIDALAAIGEHCLRLSTLTADRVDERGLAA